METDQVIDSLTADLEPVRRLRPVMLRLALWLMMALPAVAIVVAVSGLRADIAAQLADAGFRAQEIAAVATALVAAWAALAAGVPGTARWKLWLPVVPLVFWMATLGEQCWREWLRTTAAGWSFQPDLECLLSIALVGAAPAAIGLLMIRRGARFHSSLAIAWGTLAAAALANAGHLLFHPADAGLMGVVWQFLSAPLFIAVAARAKRSLLPNSG